MKTNLSFSQTHLLKDKFKISRLPIYELVEELIRVFKLNSIPSQIPYLKAFQDIIIEYKTLQGEESSSFLEWWDKNGKRKLNMTPQENEIQIITIHKSKGLEFSNVILPFFDWDLDNVGGGNREKIFWVDLLKYNAMNLTFTSPLNIREMRENSIFNTYYHNERIKAYEDNINLMYVSFTRPKDNLFILAGEQRE
ncbi:MAG: 3'-5' exonuclease [Cytophagales bacterium]